jgi:PAS domain S-box-containing protein
MESILQQSQQKTHLISEYTSDLIALTTFTLNPVYTYISPSHARIMGYEPADLIGKSSLELVHPDDRKNLLPLLKQYLNQTVKRIFTGSTPELFEKIEFRAKDKSGRWHYLESTVNLVEDELLFVSRDITERKQTEDEFKENSRFLSNILASIQDGISILDKDLRILMVNHTMKQWYAHAMPLVGKKCYEAYHGRSERCEACPSYLTLTTGEAARDIVPLRGSGGEAQGWLDLYSFPLKDLSTGEFIGVIEYVRDVTAYKTTDEALRESEQKLRRIIEQAPDGIILTDEQGTIIEWNPGMEKIVGLKREETIGRKLWEVQYQSATAEEKQKVRYEQVEAMMSDLLKTGQSPWLNRLSERQFQRPDGTRRMSQVLTFLIKTNKGYMMASIARDITNRKRMENELLKMEKLESLGILAGGIAHDFNNILSAILGNVSLAKVRVQPEDKLHTYLNNAETACARARDLTQQLLTFAKGGAPVKKTSSIAQLVHETAGFALRGSKVRCEFQIAEDLWPADVDEGQISQVIHNLVINADQAMPQGGIIEVRAENIFINGQNGIPLPEGKYIAVAVRDQGIGIPHDYISKIFDPFFTTKQRGCGLGLASCYSIIINHGGYITAASEPGAGSTFSFYLPACEKRIERRESSEALHTDGKGKILVMDDEDIIREMAQELLRGLGYEVELAGDGAEALTRYQEARASGAPVDAVIMDLTIPGGMGGEEAIQKLLAVDPEARAIVSSGYSNNPVMADYKKYGFSGVLAKPYRITELSAVLQSVMNGKSA